MLEILNHLINCVAGSSICKEDNDACGLTPRFSLDTDILCCLVGKKSKRENVNSINKHRSTCTSAFLSIFCTFEQFCDTNDNRNTSHCNCDATIIIHFHFQQHFLNLLLYTVFIE